MRPTGLIELNDTERERLNDALKQVKDIRSYRRIVAMLKLDAGESPELVAEALEVHLATVYRWIDRYCRQHSANDLLEQPRSGRPSLLGNLSDKHLDQLLRHSPQYFGHRATSWTVALLTTELQRQFGIAASDETLRRRLHRQQYRWKRPRYRYRDPDPHKGQKKGASLQR